MNYDAYQAVNELREETGEYMKLSNDGEEVMLDGYYNVYQLKALVHILETAAEDALK